MIYSEQLFRQYFQRVIASTFFPDWSISVKGLVFIIAEDIDEIVGISEEQENDLESDLEIGTDDTDVKGGQDSHIIPDVPVELTPITCPNDCLVVYPVMPGKNYLFSFMHTPTRRYGVVKWYV